MQQTDILSFSVDPIVTTTLDGQSLLPLLRIVEAFGRTLFHGLIVLDIRSGRCLHVSANSAVLPDAEREAMMQQGIGVMIDRIPVDERAMVAGISRAVRELHTQHPSDDVRALVISSNFHIMLADRQVMLNVKVTPLVLAPDGEVQVVLCALSPSVHGRAGNVVARIDGSSRYWLYNATTNQWEEQNMQHLLTADERTMLYLSAQGLTLKAIADRMHRAIDTVKGYRRHIFSKLGVSNIPEALSFAATYNLL